MAAMYRGCASQQGDSVKIRSGRFIAAGTSCATLVFVLAGCVRLPEPQAANPAGDGGHLADSAVTANVQAALNQVASLQGLDIAVATLKGDARLTGALDSQAQIKEAIRAARSAAGVYAIHDELTLRR
jgi:osmotically-inducible protein OsmY